MGTSKQYQKALEICDEFQGEQHYKKKSYMWSETLERHDIIKKDYCNRNNIKLIEIPYYDIDKIDSYFTFIRE